ncbi:unnamed protein product [Agarophyton chilense]
MASPRPAARSPSANTLRRLLHPPMRDMRDVTLIPAKSPGRTIRAHRFVLAAASPVFRASLAADPSNNVLTLAHADVDALDAALQYVYGSDDAINRLPLHALWTTLTTCISYAMHLPSKAVQHRIVHTISYTNVFYHWAMAERYNLVPVQLKCRTLVKRHFVLVSKQPQFVHITSQLLARILRIHDLIVNGEDDVFQALERWLAYDVQARAEQALHLLRLVRLPTIDDIVLLRVCRSAYFGGHNEFYQLLLEALIRRTEVRLIHKPRVHAILEHWKSAKGPGPSSRYTRSLSFKPLGANDFELFPSPQLSQSHKPQPQPPASPAPTTAAAASERDYNRKEDRTVLFQGNFPLRWYKSVRFRPRSPTSLLFSVVIPKWSLCRKRFVSESRSFLDHKWSLWVDPFSSIPSRGTRDSSSLSPQLPSQRRPSKRDSAGAFEGDTYEPADDPTSPVSPTRSKVLVLDETDYISIYLCCESEVTLRKMGPAEQIDARVDFGLFVASCSEEYGMERKVCVGRRFKSSGQAMGFRRHIRRNRLHSPTAGLYNREKDELVVGAHLVAPEVQHSRLPSELPSELTTQLGSASLTGDDFRSESPLSPSPTQLAGSRMTTMETEPSPILTSTSRVST